jgi:two-component system nitrate/nitrite response regulator NarL
MTPANAEIKPVKLLVANDRHLVREALACFLRHADVSLAVLESSSLAETVDSVGRDEIDVVIVGRELAGMSGLVGLQQIIAKRPTARVLILADSISRREAYDALRAGGAGIILKDMRGGALVSALRLVLAGETYLPAALLDEPATREPRGVPAGARFANLTRREVDVVRLLADGLSNREIAERLALAEVTVKLHLHNAFQKMGARSRSDAVRITLLAGFLKPEGESG